MSLLRRAVLALAATGLTFAVAALPAAAEDARPLTKPEIEKIVHDYLVQNPQILREMSDALQAKDQAEAQTRRAKVFADERYAIFHGPGDAVVGNPKGDVTVVEFFDYNCPYCRHALDDTNALLKSDPNLRFVLKEFPVLTPGSREAAKVALAVVHEAPGKYLAFHRELLGSGQPVDGDAALKVAEKLGISKARIAADLATPVTQTPIDNTMKLASELSIDGTPTYIVGNTVMPGAVGLDALKTAVANMRACGKAVCS
ncbi:MAG TPA: DsbA family protein [Hyphomicrobiales bacterium]|nr:DsbA family protein [Hyphomicrobiales bacterium]